METIAATTEKAEIMPLFIEHKNQAGYITKLVNFDNPLMCPRSGKVELIYIQKKEKVDPNNSFRRFTDRKTGITYGIPLGTLPNGDLEFQLITLRDFRIYDLSDLNDAKEWACVRMHHTVEGSPNAFGKPMYKILDHEYEAQKQIIKVENIERAITLAKKIIGNEIRDFARILEIECENDTDAIVKGKIFDKAIKSPEWFCKKYDDQNRPVLTVIKRCLVNAIIIFDPMKGYSTKNGLFLGDNEYATVNYLSKPENTALLLSLSNEAKEKDRYYRNTSENGASIFPKSEIPKEEDPEIKNLKEELAKQKKLNEEINTRFISLMEKLEAGNKSTESKDPITESKDPITVIPPFDLSDNNGNVVIYNGTNEKEFREYAKSIGIAYWHNKSIDTLKIEVEEKQKSLK